MPDKLRVPALEKVDAPVVTRVEEVLYRVPLPAYAVVELIVVPEPIVKELYVVAGS